MSEFRGEVKTLVQTYVELLYPDDLEMQDALFENITTGKASVTLKEMQDYVATRSSWYAEIEAVNPAMAVVHNQNDEFVGTVEVMDMDDDPDGVEVFINDEQMNELSSTNLYEDDRFWEDYDAETFNAMSESEKANRRFNRAWIKAMQKFADNPDNQLLLVRWIAQDLLFNLEVGQNRYGYPALTAIYVSHTDDEGNRVENSSLRSSLYPQTAFRELELSGKIATGNLERFKRFQDSYGLECFWVYSYKDENGQQKTYASSRDDGNARRDFTRAVYRGEVKLPSSVKDEIPAILELRRKASRKQLAYIRKIQKIQLELDKEALEKGQEGAEDIAQMMLGVKNIDSFNNSNNAETFNAESLKGRWKDNSTRVVHGVSVTKTPMAERYANEKPDYRISYKGFNARISYSGMAFYLPCWEYKSYGLNVRGKHHRSGCFGNPMEALLSFKASVDSIDMNAETFNAENEIMVHQLISPYTPGGYATTYIYRDEKDLMNAIWHDHACERMETYQEEYPEYDWDGYIDSDENRAIFDKKTKNMSIDEILEYSQLDNDLFYKKIPLNLEGFSVDGEYGEIRNLTRNSGILRAETFEAQLSFDRWSKDEMNEELHGGRDMNFEDWLEDEVHTHGNIPLKEWGDEEESESEHQHAESMLFTPHPSPPEPKDKLTGEDGYYTLPQIKRMIARDMIYHSSDGDVDFNDIFNDDEIEILTSWADEAGEDVREYIEDNFLTKSELITAVTNATSLKSMQRIFEAYRFPYRVTADRKLSDGSYEYKLELIPKFKKAQAESMMSKRGKVRTLSGKPHKAREMKKDRMISPEEAKTRLSFRARKGIDTYDEPFEEIGNFYSGKKGILKIVGLGALVSAGVWITKNKLLE